MKEDSAGRFWLKLFGAIIAFGIAGLIVMAVLSAAWYAWGAIGAFLFIAAVGLLFAWIYDRRQAREYEDLA
jgi:Flp pilus assembly protein TadB